jgi:hypothetical protein
MGGYSVIRDNQSIQYSILILETLPYPTALSSPEPALFEDKEKMPGRPGNQARRELCRNTNNGIHCLLPATAVT